MFTNDVFKKIPGYTGKRYWSVVLDNAFVNTVGILVSVQSEEGVPVSTENYYIVIDAGDIWLAEVFKTTFDILSCPLAFDVLIPDESFMTLFEVMVRGRIWGAYFSWMYQGFVGCFPPCCNRT
jgi:hypothetical protein